MNRLFGRSALFKKVSAALVLAVFILAVTPKITLHNWFANHTDKVANGPASDKTQLSKAGYNCKVDNLVAEGHFITNSAVVIINVPVFYSFVSYKLPGCPPGQVFYTALRGPPLQF
jgi:hypothetical protein